MDAWLVEFTAYFSGFVALLLHFYILHVWFCFIFSIWYSSVGRQLFLIWTDFGGQVNRFATLVDPKNNQFEVLVEKINRVVFFLKGVEGFAWFLWNHFGSMDNIGVRWTWAVCDQCEGSIWKDYQMSYFLCIWNSNNAYIKSVWVSNCLLLNSKPKCSCAKIAMVKTFDSNPVLHELLRFCLLSKKYQRTK